MEELKYSEIIDAGQSEASQQSADAQQYQTGIVGMDYAAAEKANAYHLMKSADAEPLVLRFRRHQKQAEAEVRRLKELIALLEKNPETERILQLMQR